MINPKQKPNQKGFTIVELMIATTVFSVVLLLCTFSFLRIGQVFYKGAALSRTQDNARAIIDEVSGAIKLSGDEVSSLRTHPATGIQGYCIGGNMYSFNPNPQMRDEAGDSSLSVRGSCPSSGPSLSSGRELVDMRMRLERFEVVRVDEGLYRVVVRVVQGDDYLIEDLDGSNDGFRECKNEDSSYFCASSELETTVKRRI